MEYKPKMLFLLWHKKENSKDILVYISLYNLEKTLLYTILFEFSGSLYGLHWYSHFIDEKTKSPGGLAGGEWQTKLINHGNL